MMKTISSKGHSRLLNYFSDPVSEFPLTYRGELIDGDSITSGPKVIALNSIKKVHNYSINPITPPQPPA
jgi:hypothetical protein